MTLALSLAAAKRLAAPEAVFTDARAWSQHIGIISEDRHTTEEYIRNHGLTQDFFTGEYDKAESLTLVSRQFETDRYVYLGTNEDDRRAANASGWEYFSIEEAAAKADWELAAPAGGSGMDKIIRFLKKLW